MGLPGQRHGQPKTTEYRRGKTHLEGNRLILDGVGPRCPRASLWMSVTDRDLGIPSRGTEFLRS